MSSIYGDYVFGTNKCKDNDAFSTGVSRTLIAFFGLFLVIFVLLLAVAAIRLFSSKHKSKALARWWAFAVSIILGILSATSHPRHVSL